MRPIDADALVTKLQNEYDPEIVGKKTAFIALDIILDITDTPSIEPERTKAEWAQKVEQKYAEALNRPYIKKPLAYALYEVWKEYDRNDQKEV